MSFIEQEANEKVQEIEVKGEEEFEIEKSRLVAQQRLKIIESFEKREKQIELQRIRQRSHVLNANRLLILQYRDDLLHRLKDEAIEQLSTLMKDRSIYIGILVKLISESLLLLLLTEDQLLIRCRQDDYGLVQRLIPDALRQVRAQMPTISRQIDVTVDNKHFLSDHLYVNHLHRHMSIILPLQNRRH